MNRISSFFALALLVGLPAFADESHAPTPVWREVPYGTSTPKLDCTPLSACLVTLQSGETIQSRFLADSAGWEVEPGTTGAGQRLPILAIKPHRCNESTNLFISTDRRIYSLLLNAPPCDEPTLKAEATQIVRFVYPEEFARSWGDDSPVAAPVPGLALQAPSLTALNFAYQWSAGRHAVDPQVVYDDGKRTYIVLRPEDAARGYAPAVFALNGKNLEALNFTPPQHGSTTYVVDRVVPALALVLGNDRNQRTEIRRKGDH
jgi:type IV secretory pathway VirB9-like protein